VNDLEIQIRTDLEVREIGGVDTIIAKMPKDFVAEIDGEEYFLLEYATKALRALAEWSAKNIEENLHHADFYITMSKSTVQAKGGMHNCDSCRAGVRRGLRELEKEPDVPLVVGVLYWAGPKVRIKAKKAKDGG
jgi:predicted PP-loop superfamily ATPase